ncbi:MAG: DUF4124 domain-containing protein [Candidatus Binatia bacterium]
MRRNLVVAVVTMGVLGLLASGPLWAAGPSDEVYRWVDGQGRVHYSNVPAPGAEPTGIVADDDAAPPSAAVQGENEGNGIAPSPAPPSSPNQESALDPNEAEAVASRVSVERRQLDRELKQTQRELQDIDTRLDTLARARTAHAKGTPGTGGVGTNAAAYQSDEETQLAKRRAELLDRTDKARSQYGKLRAEVTSAAGTTPDW